MELIKSIVNDYTTYLAFKLINDDNVFIYDNGLTKIVNITEFLSK